MCHMMWHYQTADRLKSNIFNGRKNFHVFSYSFEIFTPLGDLNENFLSLMIQVKVRIQLSDQNAI